MAQAKPMSISVTTLAAFNAIAELRAWAVPLQRFAHQPGFLRCMDEAFLLTLTGSPAAPVYRLLYGSTSSRSVWRVARSRTSTYPFSSATACTRRKRWSERSLTRHPAGPSGDVSPICRVKLLARCGQRSGQADPQVHGSANLQPVNQRAFRRASPPSAATPSSARLSLTTRHPRSRCLYTMAAGSSMPFGRVRASLIRAPTDRFRVMPPSVTPHLTDFPIGGRMACGDSLVRWRMACGPRRPLSLQRRRRLATGRRRWRRWFDR